MAVYTPFLSGDYLRSNAIEFIAADYDNKVWTRRIEWVYRRVHFMFDDGWLNETPGLAITWKCNGCNGGWAICSRSMKIHAATPTNTKTVTIDQVSAWVDSTGYLPSEVDELVSSEFIDLAH